VQSAMMRGENDAAGEKTDVVDRGRG
jgi:hypothetical protein